MGPKKNKAWSKECLKEAVKLVRGDYPKVWQLCDIMFYVLHCAIALNVMFLQEGE